MFMKSSFRLLFVVSAVLSLASCDKPLPPAAAAPVAAETDNQLAEARDALQRQALEIETKTALMDKQLAEMAQSLKERDNAELRDSLDALKRQNEALRVQADAARQQSNAITQRIVVAPQPNVVPQPDYSLFYDRLAPFGRWFEVNGYGYCWRPTITVAGWRPYVDGCWVWSSLGWAWQSNEPFGWATYHYGRWVNLARYGWIWVPGSEWAPAWVAWRQSRDCVGWAPLPPETGVFSGAYRDCDSRYGLGPTSYTFINTTQFVSPTYINIYAPVTRQTTIFQHSVNVTQIVPSHSRGNAFVHQGGPPRGQMEQACGQPVPQRQVQSMHADQMPTRPQHHGRRDADAPVAMVELPAVAPGAHMRRPEIKERIQKPVLMGGFEGVPQQAAREIRENIAQEKETAVVQQQPPMRGHMQHGFGRHPVAPPAVVNGTPVVPNAPPPETVSPAGAAEKLVPAQSVAPVETATVQQQPGQVSMPRTFPGRSTEAPVIANMPSVPNALAQETVRPSVAAESGSAREPRRHGQPGMRAPQAPNEPPESKVVENSTPAAAPSTPSVMPAVVENKAPEPLATPVVPVSEPERTPPAMVITPPAVMPQQPADSIVSQQPVAAEKMAADQVAATAAEAEKAQMHAAREQTRAAAMEQRQQQGLQERGMAEKRAAEQAAANAEAEKNRMQAAAAQQETLAAQQQRMAADQAAAEAEKARQQAAATATQQQQEMAAQQQRATAERMASEQAAAAEAERVRQQTEAAAMQQRQQEEATRRAAEEQQMKAQQETERRTQEMAAQRQAEEQARRQQEAEMQRAQEQARRAAEEQQMRAQQEAAQRAQEMAQRQAEEQARRQQEAEMQRAQEQARRAAEEQQMRAQQEAAQRAQEMAQRQAEEQARRAQEMAQRQAEEQARRAQEEAQRAAAEAAQRAAAEAARNQPQPAPGS
jgi:hypothetical protein